MRATPLRRWAATLVVAGLGLLGLPATGPVGVADASATGARRVAAGVAARFQHACGTPTKPRTAACTALVRTDVAQRAQAALGPDQPPAGTGYGPASLQSAYALPSSSAGAGLTVAIVDAFDDPKAEADLATYRADWGLPPCTSASGCFTKVNEIGQPSPLPPAAGSTGWATELSLDIDMVSAICPNCHILLVEGTSPTVTDLGTAVNTAVSMGAVAVSNSYATTGEYEGEADDDATYYDHPGVAVTASAGDSGYGVGFPAISPHVVAVGGTSLTPASNSRGWAETVWNGTGSGCSVLEPKPFWQADPGCANRTDNDVAAVADPQTGVAMYDTYDRSGWLEVGGTSVSSPIIASVYALAGQPQAATYPAAYPYAHTTALNDVTTGANGSCDPAYLCTAGPGYDGPTGLGTPDGVAAFTAPAGDFITVFIPGSQAATQDIPFSLQIRAVDSTSGQTLSYSASGLPPGLSIDQATGLISGTPTALGTFQVLVNVTDTAGTSGSATFTITVVSPVSLSGPGPQGGYAGQPALATFTASDAVPGRTIRSVTAAGLPPGLSIDASTSAISGLPTGDGYYHPTVTATDSAGRTGSTSFVWYVAPAQVNASPGPVKLGVTGKCLTAPGGTLVEVTTCTGKSSQAWTVQPGGTVRALGNCLTAAGGVAQLSPCEDSGAQQWRIGSSGELVNPASGNCLADPGSPPATGAQVVIQACAGGAGQRWIAPAGPIVSGVTGLCADSGAATTGHLQIWNCAATAAQAWTVQPDGTVQESGKCLTVTGGDSSTGTPVDLARCGAGAAQQWQVIPDGTLVNPQSGKCLADPGDTPVAGTTLVVAGCAPSAGQLWHIE